MPAPPPSSSFKKQQRRSSDPFPSSTTTTTTNTTNYINNTDTSTITTGITPPPPAAIFKKSSSFGSLSLGSIGGDNNNNTTTTTESLIDYERTNDTISLGAASDDMNDVDVDDDLNSDLNSVQSSTMSQKARTRLKLFSDLDSQLTDATVRLCFAVLSVFVRGFPGCDDALPCIPRSVAFTFMREIVDDCDPVDVVDRLELYNFRTVSFREKEVGCVQLSHKIYVEYGGHVLMDLLSRGELREWGGTKEEVMRRWNEVLVELLETADDWVSKIYMGVVLPHHCSETKRESLLLSASFASQRLNVLGVADAIQAHIFDCEKFPECLPDAYNIISSQLKNVVEWSPDISVQIGSSYLALAKSLKRLDLDSLSFFEVALSTLASLLDYKSNPAASLLSAPLLHSAQLDMAETLHNLGELSDDDVQYHRALQIRKILLGALHPIVAKTLHCIGVLNANRGKYEDALEKFEEVLRIRRLLSKETHDKETELGVAETVEWIGHVEKQMENYERARNSYKEAIHIRSMYGELKDDVACLYHALGSIYEDMDDLDNSLQEYGEALRIRRITCPGKQEMLETLFALARIYERRGKVDYALECFREAAEKKAGLLTQNVTWIRDWSKRDDARVLPMPMYRDGEGENEVVFSPDLEQDAWGNMKDNEKFQVADLLKIMMHVVDISVQKHGHDDSSVGDAFAFMAMIYLKIGAYNKAIKSFEEVSRIRTHNGRDKDDTMADVSYHLAMCYARTGNYSKAVKKYNLALGIRHVLKSDATKIADLWYNIGNAQNAMGLREEAHQSLCTALHLRRSSGLDDVEILNVEYCIAVIDVHLSKYDGACPVLEEILPKYEELLGQEHLNVAHTLYHLGQIYYSSVSLEEPSEEPIENAFLSFRNALQIYRKVLDKNHIVMAHVSLVFGVIYGIRGEYYESRQNLENALKIYKAYRQGEHRGVDIALNHLGEICACTNEHLKSLMYFQQALQVREKLLGTNHQNVADILHNLGGINCKLNKYEDAIECYERVLRIRVETFSKKDLSLAQTLNNLGIVYARTGVYALATERLKKALKLRIKYQEDSDDLACTLYNLGNVHANTKSYDLAAKCYDETLRIRRRLYGDNHPSVAKTLHNLGALHEEDKKYERAKIYFDEALKVKHLFLDPSSLSIALTLSRVAGVQIHMGDYTNALRCYEESIKAQKKHHGPDHPSIAKTYLKIGTARRLTGNIDLALMSYEEALRIFEESSDAELEPDIAHTLYMIGSIYEMQGNNEESFIHYGNAYHLYKKAGNAMDQNRRRVMLTIRKILAGPIGSAGFSDTFVVTGDCWLGVERTLYYFVNMLSTFLTGQQAVISPTRQESDKHIRTIYDAGLLIEN